MGGHSAKGDEYFSRLSLQAAGVPAVKCKCALAPQLQLSVYKLVINSSIIHIIP